MWFPWFRFMLNTQISWCKEAWYYFYYLINHGRVGRQQYCYVRLLYCSVDFPPKDTLASFSLKLAFTKLSCCLYSWISLNISTTRPKSNQILTVNGLVDCIGPSLVLYCIDFLISDTWFVSDSILLINGLRTALAVG